MKEIKAFVKPNKVDNIIKHLKEKGFDNITVVIAEGTGRMQNYDNEGNVAKVFSSTDDKIAKLELVVKNDEVESVVWIISEHGQTESPGDGIIYISDVLRTIRVKTGEDIL